MLAEVAPLAENGMGAKLRGARLDKLSTPTIPQIFIAGEVIGGCTELFAANDDGSLKQLLE